MMKKESPLGISRLAKANPMDRVKDIEIRIELIKRLIRESSFEVFSRSQLEEAIAILTSHLAQLKK